MQLQIEFSSDMADISEGGWYQNVRTRIFSGYSVDFIGLLFDPRR